MKPFTAICLLWIAAASLPLSAIDGDLITVRSSAVSNRVVLIQAQLSGKDTQLECFVDTALCTAAPVGEYVMVRADIAESIYMDCTNVVLYKNRPNGTNEKVGVYCWLGSGDCYIFDCTSVRVDTYSSDITGMIRNEGTRKTTLAATDVATAVGSTKAAIPQIGPPPYYRELVRMANCRTLSCLDSVWRGIPHSEITTRIVYFSKRMMIRPTASSANGLLDAIPATEREQLLFANFESWHDNVTENTSDMEALSRIYGMWPRLIARAALLSSDPKRMLAYVGYLALAPNDIHSDFTGNAQRVCRKQPTLFRNSFHNLTDGQQKYISGEAFDANKCKAIFRSEAE